MWPRWQSNPNPAKFVDDLCNFVCPTLWFPLRRVWGQPKHFLDGGEEDVMPWPCQEVMPGSKMCQRSRWSSLCPPGSGGEGWDWFSFVSEKWLCPSCSGAGARVAAKVLPARTAGDSAAHRGWTHTFALLGGAHRGLRLVFLFYKLLISLKKSSFVLLLRFVLLLHPW